MDLEKLFWNFVSYVQDKQLKVEGIAVGDEKQVILEHHFVQDRPRNIYSHTKSYTSTAAGLAIKEGKVSLEDRLVDYFPEYVPENPHPWLLQINLRHLLTMSSGFGKPYLMEERREGVGLPDYITYLMKQEMQDEPGSRFVYSNGDTVLVGRMVEKAVGMHLGEYLYQNLFSKMDIGWPAWEHDVRGHAFGASGLIMKLTDMMKLGQLYLADGVWKGENIISHDWIKQATAVQIPISYQDDRKWWNCGYGYQFWKNPYPGSYRAAGAFGQETIVMPGSGLVVAVQCPEDGDYENVWRALDTELLGEF